MTQCPTGDHEPNVRGHLLLYQPRPLNTAAGPGPLRVGRKEKKLENKQDPWQSSKPQGRRAAPRAERSARTERFRSPRDPRSWTLPAGGALGRVPRAGAGRRCCRVRAPPPPPLHVTPLGQSAQASATRGPRERRREQGTSRRPAEWPPEAPPPLQLLGLTEIAPALWETGVSQVGSPDSRLFSGAGDTHRSAALVCLE